MANSISEVHRRPGDSRAGRKQQQHTSSQQSMPNLPFCLSIRVKSNCLRIAIAIKRLRPTLITVVARVRLALNSGTLVLSLSHIGGPGTRKLVLFPISQHLSISVRGNGSLQFTQNILRDLTVLTATLEDKLSNLIAGVTSGHEGCYRSKEATVRCVSWVDVG